MTASAPNYSNSNSRVGAVSTSGSSKDHGTEHGVWIPSEPAGRRGDINLASALNSQENNLQRTRSTSITAESTTDTETSTRSLARTAWDEFTPNVPPQSYRRTFSNRSDSASSVRSKETNPGFANLRAVRRMDLGQKATAQLQREEKRRQAAAQSLHVEDDDDDSGSDVEL